jgi:PTS system N-acetylglucosamine-specific IIC component
MRTASRTPLRTAPGDAAPPARAATQHGGDATGGHDAPGMLAALGGLGNIRKLETAAGRLLVSTLRPELIDEAALRILGIRGIARPDGMPMQVLVAGGVEGTAESLRRLLRGA